MIRSERMYDYELERELEPVDRSRIIRDVALTMVGISLLAATAYFISSCYQGRYQPSQPIQSQEERTR